MTTIREGVEVEFGAKLAPLLGGLNAAKLGIAGFAGFAVTKLAQVEMASLRTAASWERSMAEIQTISRVSTAELARMERQTRDLSVAYGQTFDKVARARYDVISSGFTRIADSQAIMTAASKLAVGGLTDVSVAAKVLANTLNAYELSAQYSARISDILFKSVEVGVFTFEELAQNLGDVTASAHAAGYSIEETLAALATISKGGIVTPEAVTALNQLFLTMIKPAKAAKQIIAEVGLSLDDDLGTTLKKVSALSDESINKLSTVFDNVRALKGALTAAAEGGKRFADSLESIRDNAGAAEDAAKVMEGTVSEIDKRIEAQKASLEAAWGKAQLDNVKKLKLAWLDVLGAIEKGIEDFDRRGLLNLGSLLNLDPMGTGAAFGTSLATRAPIPAGYDQFIPDTRSALERFTDALDDASNKINRVLFPGAAMLPSGGRRPYIPYAGPGLSPEVSAALGYSTMLSQTPRIRPTADLGGGKSGAGGGDGLVYTARALAMLDQVAAQAAVSVMGLSNNINAAFPGLKGGRGLTAWGSVRMPGAGDESASGLVGPPAPSVFDQGGGQGFNLRGVNDYGLQARDRDNEERYQKALRKMAMLDAMGQSVAANLSSAIEQGIYGQLVKAFGGGQSAMAQFAAQTLSQLASIIVQATLLKGILSVLGLPFSGGGYTGSYAFGGYTGASARGMGVAGVVHKNEYVLNERATQRVGTHTLDMMNRGFGDVIQVGDIYVNGSETDVNKAIAEKIQRGLPDALRTVRRSGQIRAAYPIGKRG